MEKPMERGARAVRIRGKKGEKKGRIGGRERDIKRGCVDSIS